MAGSGLKLPPRCRSFWQAGLLNMSGRVESGRDDGGIRVSDWYGPHERPKLNFFEPPSSGYFSEVAVNPDRPEGCLCEYAPNKGGFMRFLSELCPVHEVPCSLIKTTFQGGDDFVHDGKVYSNGPDGFVRVRDLGEVRIENAVRLNRRGRDA